LALPPRISRAYKAIVADEETELMLRVAGGDEAAFEPLVRRVLPRLVGYFRRLGADAALAEDCAQDTLLKIYKARAKYAARARFLTFLFHVARNHWIDVYRQRRAGPRFVSAHGAGRDEERGAPEFPAPARDPGGAIARDQLVAALERAVQSLADEHREVFVLARVESLRYQEIGEILGIPVGTVKSRMHAAWKQIRAALRREGIEP
jgi:RNA polymerase sigma-70 factor (ECF subfamily)